ncbi:MAG: hypothetical protein LBR95_03775, partial [Azoarcus sp.]|nr:hypothetical protein [Azoarcus sp.]
AATAGEPIKDKDAFEKQSIECIMSGVKDGCWSKLFIKHTPPDDDKNQDLVNALRKIEVFVGDRGSVYKVHPVERTTVADISDGRVYVIEYSSGRFCGVFIHFKKIKESWYISTFSVNDEDVFFKKIFKFPI